MNFDPQTPADELRTPTISKTHVTRLKIVGLLLTLGGISLFSYFIYIQGISQIAADIEQFGWIAFVVILGIYFLRIFSRAWAWKLSVYEPYSLSLRDTIQAVIIGESLSALIPLGILISGTTKAVAVRRKVPLVVGLSSVATENLFYSVITSTFLILGAVTFLRTFNLDEGWVLTLDIVIGVIIFVILFIILMVIRQWHFASATCEWLYEKGIGRRLLEHGRLHVRLFENLIYGFYRKYPRRFLPICGFEAAFHSLGVLEAYFILSRLVDVGATPLGAFLLESVNRMILVVFKLIPFLVGVDEAGMQFVTEVIGVGAGVGVTMAIIRKGRVLFWTAVGLLLIMKRGLSLKDISRMHDEPAADG